VVHKLAISGVVAQQRQQVVGDHLALAQQLQGLPVVVKVAAQEAVDVSKAFCTCPESAYQHRASSTSWRS
jgi:hypothetical protein